MRLIKISFALLWAAPAWAIPQAVSVSSQDQIQTPRWMYNSSEALPTKAPLRTLARLKQAQMNSNWELCQELAPKAQTLAPSLASWITLLEMECALQTKTLKPAQLTRLANRLDTVEKNTAWLLLGAPSARLRKAFVSGSLLILQNDLKDNRTRAWKIFDRIEKYKSWMGVGERAQLYRLAGELSFFQQKLEVARNYLVRSLQEMESEEARSRLRAVEQVLQPKGELPEARLNTQSLNANIEASSEELELVSRVTAALKAGDVIPAAEDAVRLIRRFPGGSRAKWATERVQEVYLSVAGKNEEKYQLLKERILNQMEKVDADRQAEWAQLAFSRGQYQDAFVLAREALKALGNTPRATKTVELAAEAALHTDHLSQARSLFSELIEKHAGTASARDALFHAALIDYRNKDYTRAAALLEKLLTLPISEARDLSARYFLWRSLQSLNAERAVIQAKTILEKYPFSYYGIRVSAEQNGGAFQVPVIKPTKSESTSWLTSRERLVWEKMNLLLQAGWLEETQEELRELPPPVRPEEKALRARYWAAAMSYPTALKWLNEAWDAKSDLRREPFLSAAFPREFFKEIKVEAEKQGLDPYLVMALIRQESAFQVRATSTSNAMGLMQIIPPTAKEIAGELKISNLQIPDSMFQPAQNIQMGTYYLARMLQKFKGHVPLALAAYNAGPTRLERWLNQRNRSLKDLPTSRSSAPNDEVWFEELPWDETRFYVRAILRNRLLYKALDQGRVTLQNPTWQ